jgi:hypothetical protein
MENKSQPSVSESRREKQRIAFPDLRSLNHSYWFRLLLEEAAGLPTEIRYKVTVRFIQPQTSTSALLSIDRAPDIYMNDQPVDQAVDRLAYETGRVFYPLVVETDTRMKRLGICNHSQIIRRWESVQPALKRDFTGEEAERYLNRMNESLASKEKLEEIFEEELFFQLYFRVLYADDASPDEEGIAFSFSVGNYAPVRFVIEKQSLTPGKNGRVEVSQSGVEQGRQVWPGAGSGEKNRYSADFVLDAQTHIIRQLVASWDFRFPVERKVKVILFPLRQAVSGIPPVEPEEVRKKQRKGFFSRLFGE